MAEMNHKNSSSTNKGDQQPNAGGDDGKKAHEGNRICRDFIRGGCRRAKLCRYPHVMSSDQVIFCHDYQNMGCARVNCRFLHYTISEEDYYRQYGKFPPPNEQPPAADWPGNYNRGNNPPPDMWNSSNNNGHGGYEQRFGDNGPFQVKRPRFLEHASEGGEASYHNDVVAMMKRFEEEQSMLRRRVEVNEIKIAELRANNEYLMLHLRGSRMVNPVTVNTSQQPTTQVISATPMQVMATPQTQIIASSAPLAIQPTINTTQPISQIIGSQITLTPGITMTSQPSVIAMSQATQPIISYPVMTHMPH